MEKEVILLVIAALISITSSLITITFNFRLSRRLWHEQEQYKAQRELRKSLTYGIEDVRRHGLGPLRGKNDANTETEILPFEIAKLEIDSRKLIEILESIDSPSVNIGALLHLALDIDRTNSD